MLRESYPYYLANRPQTPNVDLAVVDKYTGETAARVAQANPAAIDRGIAAAVEAAEPMARMAPYQRQAALQHCVERFTQRSEDLALALCMEAGQG